MNRALGNGIRNSKKRDFSNETTSKSSRLAHGFDRHDRTLLVDVMKFRWLLIALILESLTLCAQNTNVTATIVDSTSQPWNNGSYSITFVPNPSQPGPYYWQGSQFVPQKYTGSMNGSGTLTVTLPDNNTITPSGSQWAFVLCANTSAACSTITIPVTGASEDLSSIFSSRVTPPLLYSSPMPRAYSSSEIYIPPPNQGGQYYNVTQNLPYFWNGMEWFALGGTVTSVGLSLPGSVFFVTGSPVTASGTLAGNFVSQSAYTLFANCTGVGGTPSFCQLNAAMIAVAGTLSNTTTGDSGGVTGGYVSSIASTSAPLTITPTQGNSIASLALTGTEGKLVTAAGSSTSGDLATWDSSGGIGGTVGQIIPVSQKTEINSVTGCSFPNDGANLQCTNSVVLATAMADTSYTVSCVEYTNASVSQVVLGNISPVVIADTTHYSFIETTQGSSSVWPSFNNYGKTYVCTAYHP